MLNRTEASDSNNNKTPFEKWFDKKSGFEHIRVFGSEAFMHIPKVHTKKFDPRSKKMLLVGYEGESRNYRVYDPTTKRVSISRDVVFNEQCERDLKEDDKLSDGKIKLCKTENKSNNRQ